jgi:hypothetical protein
MRPDDPELGMDCVHVRPDTEVFKTEAEANAAYIKAEQVRIDRLEELWQAAWEDLLAFKVFATI